MYEERWNFPKCIGAMDGKHIVVKQPRNNGSYYFNYKGTFSVVLLAVVDADYKFIYVNVGCNGQISDGGVFKNSSLSSALEENLLEVPSPRQLISDNNQSPLPYFLVADDAFPLKTNIMKPYPFRGLSKEKRIFNYRLSRARRIVENAFGIMANRFRIFMSPILVDPENVVKVTLACCVLHNFLREKVATQYTPSGTLDAENVATGATNLGDWRDAGGNVLQSTGTERRNNYTNDAKEIRDHFCTYFNSSGAVPWQEKFV